MAAGGPRTALAEASRSALGLADEALPLVERLGGAGDLRALCEHLRTQLGEDEVVVALAGTRRVDAMVALLDESVAAPEPAAGVRVRLRGGAELGFEARRPDGRVERPPPDRRDELAASLALLDRAVAAEEARVRELGERLAAAERAAAEACDALAAAESGRGESHAGESQAAGSGTGESLAAGSGAGVRALAPVTPALEQRSRALAPVAPAVEQRSRALAMWLWLVALIRSIFGRAAAAPPPALPPVDDGLTSALARARRITAATDERSRTADALLTLGRELPAAQARLAKVAAERDQRRRMLDDYRDQQRGRIVEALLALVARPDAPSLDVEVTAPGLGAGIAVLLRASGDLWREPVDATLLVDGEVTRDRLRADLDGIRDRRPAEIARRVAALLCSCRNHIVDVAERARHANQDRLGELVARRIATPDAFKQQAEVAAQRPIARGAEQIVDEAATRLDRLVDEARQAWEQRIDSCAGIEQLRAEVAAIENGAAHRLSLVCDELRETMTVQFVRLVLELSRPLRQELLRKRLEVARGRSPKTEETFEDIRLAFPASLDKAFAALRTPDIGELLTIERSLFDPLFRTLGRERRDCLTRLRARLDDVARTTARELYASTVFVSPLLQTTFSRLVDELLAAHERWIEARASEERQAYGEQRTRLLPALELVDPLVEREKELARLLESCGDGDVAGHA